MRSGPGGGRRLTGVAQGEAGERQGERGGETHGEWVGVGSTQVRLVIGELRGGQTFQRADKGTVKEFRDRYLFYYTCLPEGLDELLSRRISTTQDDLRSGDHGERMNRACYICVRPPPMNPPPFQCGYQKISDNSIHEEGAWLAERL